MRLAASQGRPEVFYSLQGEGPRTGVPSVFLRLALCNLHCWWCDTDYTWNWRDKQFAHRNDSDPGYARYDRDHDTAALTPAAVAELVAPHRCPNLVLTGGEPLLQQPELTALLTLLREGAGGPRTEHVEIETNGTLLPGEGLDALVDQYNVSPKLSTSRNPKRRRECVAALRFFAASSKSCFKFVLAAADEVDEVQAMVGEYGIRRDRVYLMPEGTDSAALDCRGPWIAQVCMETGYRYSDRLSVRLFGGVRGR